MPGPTLEPWEATLDFNQTLAELAGLLGKQVTVTSSDRDGKPIIVTRMQGVLHRAQDVTIVRQREDAEAQFFHVSPQDSPDLLTGFMMHRGSFGGGEADSDARVRFLQGAVLVDVRLDRELLADDRPHA